MIDDERKRRSIRLPTYDYSDPGFYFVTICAQDFKCGLGEIKGDEMILSRVGKLVISVWGELPLKFSNIHFDKFQIMPNHIHGIIEIRNCRGLIYQTLIYQTPNQEDWQFNFYGRDKSRDGRDKSRPYIPKNPMRSERLVLGRIIRYFKGKSAYLIHKKGFKNFQWQRNYYERIIRSEEELAKIREYVVKNPILWDQDRNNPKNFQKYGKISARDN